VGEPGRKAWWTAARPFIFQSQRTHRGLNDSMRNPTSIRPFSGSDHCVGNRFMKTLWGKHPIVPARFASLSLHYEH
jgi:hypothetical protein